jgi:hypothetical protein
MVSRSKGFFAVAVSQLTRLKLPQNGWLLQETQLNRKLLAISWVQLKGVGGNDVCASGITIEVLIA